MGTPQGMLSGANPLLPYRSDKLTVCSQSFSSTQPEVRSTFVALHWDFSTFGFGCFWLHRLSSAVSEPVFGFHQLFLMRHVMLPSWRFLTHNRNLHQNWTRPNGVNIAEQTLFSDLISWNRKNSPEKANRNEWMMSKLKQHTRLTAGTESSEIGESMIYFPGF